MVDSDDELLPNTLENLAWHGTLFLTIKRSIIAELLVSQL